MRKPQHLSLNERRHTKPCKFFQKNTCPLSADRCQFAHVRENATTKTIEAPTQVHNYHLTGDCGERDHCSYQHTHPSFEQRVTKPDMYLQTAIGSRFNSVDPGELTPYPHPTHPHTLFPQRHTHFPPPTYIYAPYILPPAQAPSPTSAPASRRDSLLDSEIDLDLDIPSLGSASSPSAESSSLTDGDADILNTPLDEMHVYPGSRQLAGPPGHVWGSPWSPDGTFFDPASPGMYGSYMPFTPMVYGGFYGPMSAVPGLDPPHIGRKGKAYKTKLCKFFKKCGECPKGEKCTFIHSPASVRRRPVNVVPLSPMSSRLSLLSENSPLTPVQSESLRFKLPRKPLSDIDEKHANNIFPITWRVIGGGVMMGGQREICQRFMEGHCAEGDDCRFFHPDQDELLSPIAEEYYPAGLSDSITPRVASFKEEPHSTSLPKDKRSNPLSIAIPPPPHHLPDLSPLIIPGRGDSEVVRVGVVLRDIARPHSTPPRLWALKSAARILEPQTLSVESPFP